MLLTESVRVVAALTSPAVDAAILAPGLVSSEAGGQSRPLTDTPSAASLCRDRSTMSGYVLR